MKTQSLSRFLASGAVAMSLLLGASAAQAVNVDFGDTNVGVFPYIEDGFRFTLLKGSAWTIKDSNGNPPAGLFTGTTAPSPVDTISVTYDAGLPFFFENFDYAADFTEVSDKVLFLGFEGGDVEYSLLNVGSLSSIWQTWTVTDWGAVDELWIVVTDIGNTGLVLDNIGLSAVPVPAAVWLFGSALLGLLGVARRRRMSA